MTTTLILALLLVVGGFWTILAGELIRAAVGLAFTSVILSLMMFQLGAPWAGVFELSVCAGLITVVFVSAISLTKRLSLEEEEAMLKGRIWRYIWIPIFVLAGGALIFFLYSPPALPSIASESSAVGTREVIWNVRRFDLLGQILVILSGIIGVVVLFKDWDSEGGK